MITARTERLVTPAFHRHASAFVRPCAQASRTIRRNVPGATGTNSAYGSWEEPEDAGAGARTASTLTATNPASRLQQAEALNTQKLKLLAALASLDRGLAANVVEAKDVEDMVNDLCAMAGPVRLAGAALDLLPGTWRLLYTSGFNTGSLGGRRPGPPAALFPAVLGQVFQRISPSTGHLDNIVEFLSPLPLPALPPPLGSGQTESAALRLTLRHDYQVQGERTVQIVFEDTSAELVGSSVFAQLPRFDFPSLPEVLRPPKNFRAATFDVVFLDQNMRVTRGDRGELRVYMRDADAAVPLATATA